MTEETIFDKIISGEIPASKVYEDDNFLAFLDIMPFEKGHTLVVPKKRYATIFDIPEEEYLKLQKIVHKIAGQIRKKLRRDRRQHELDLPGHPERGGRLAAAATVPGHRGVGAREGVRVRQTAPLGARAQPPLPGVPGPSGSRRIAVLVPVRSATRDPRL